MTPDQQAFEDRCWEHYLAERARRTMPGDVEGEPTREGLFWRRDDGLYGVLAFNTAWMAYQWGMQAVLTEPFGCVTVVRKLGHEDMHHFYRHPQPPYLDNASECHTVYTHPAQQAERKPLFADLIAKHDGLADELKAIDAAVDAQHGDTNGR